MYCTYDNPELDIQLLPTHLPDPTQGMHMLCVLLCTHALTAAETSLPVSQSLADRRFIKRLSSSSRMSCRFSLQILPSIPFSIHTLACLLVRIQ
jgi:hypothetical protein